MKCSMFDFSIDEIQKKKNENRCKKKCTIRTDKLNKKKITID